MKNSNKQNTHKVRNNCMRIELWSWINFLTKFEINWQMLMETISK